MGLAGSSRADLSEEHGKDNPRSRAGAGGGIALENVPEKLPAEGVV